MDWVAIVGKPANERAVLHFRAGQHTKAEKSAGSSLAACLRKFVTKGDEFITNSAGTYVSWFTPNLFLPLKIVLLRELYSFMKETEWTKRRPLLN